MPDSWIHNITHFNVNKAKLDGKMVKLFDVPVCWSDFANYFNMYGKVYYDVNSGKDAIFREIDKAVAAGTQVVEIRVASREVYDALRTPPAGESSRITPRREAMYQSSSSWEQQKLPPPRVYR